MASPPQHHHPRSLCGVDALRSLVSEAVKAGKKDITGAITPDLSIQPQETITSSTLSPSISVTPSSTSSSSTSSTPQSVRIPISLTLLQSISQLRNGDRTDSHAIEEIIRQASTISNKFQNTNMGDQDFIQLFSQSTPSVHAAINWQGVVLKLHEILSQAKGYEQLVRDIHKSSSPKISELSSSSSSIPLPLPPRSPDRGASKQLSNSDMLVIKKEVSTRAQVHSASLLRDALETLPASPLATSSNRIINGAASPEIAVPFDYHVETDPVMLPDGSHYDSRPSSAASSLSTPSFLNMPPSSFSTSTRRSSIPFNPPLMRGWGGVDESEGYSSTTTTPSSSFSRYSASPVPATEWAAPHMALPMGIPDDKLWRRTSEPKLDPPLGTSPAIPSSLAGFSVLSTAAPLLPNLSVEEVGSIPRGIASELQGGVPVPTVAVPIVVETPIISDNTVPASSSFKPTPIKRGFLVNNIPNSPRLQETPSASLPFWLDFVLYWGTEDATKVSTGLKIDARSVLITMNSMGRLDHYLRAHVTRAIHAQLYNQIENEDHELLESVFAKWAASNQHKFTKPDPTLHLSITEYFPVFCKEYSSRLWNKEKLDTCMLRIVNAYSATAAVSTEEAVMQDIMDGISSDLLYLVRVQHRPSLKLIEDLLVGLLGHDLASVRTQVVKLLNVLYDGHAWQHQEPLPPVVRCVGDAFRIQLGVETKELIAGGTNIYLITITPPNRDNNKAGDNKKLNGDKSTHKNTEIRDRLPVSMFSMHRLNDLKTQVVELHSFEQAGYFDWRIAEMNGMGEFLPLKLPKTEGATSEFLQGRFIVHPPVREEVMHEVWVDLQGAVWDSMNGTIHKRGGFSNLIDALDEYCGDGITTLYVMGALDHRPEDHPFCPTDRATPTRHLGGESGFADLVNAANARGVKIIVDATSKLSARGRHRKYNDNICMTMDDKGYMKPMMGTDSVEFEWPECSMLNYRQASTWDLVVSEALQWADRGANGLRLDGAHTWPLILRADMSELYRLDPDGVSHYTPAQILSGVVVMQKWENEAKNFGYWGTVPKSPTRDTPFYPNPLFIKLTRELWLRYPKFTFLAEVQWERELPAIVSGLIPYSCALPTALNSVFAKGLNKDGLIFDLGGRATVRAFYDYYEMRAKTYPQNSILLYPSSTHHTPYPLAFYSHGTWATIDLLYFLPEIPMTYIGEHSGWVYSVDIYTNRVRGGPNHASDKSHIRGHYNHRTSMRKAHPFLNSGGMIPLLCYHATGWHDTVFAFARFIDNEIAIVAINFGNVSADFYVDIGPLSKICTNDDVIYRMADLIEPSNPPQYLTKEEFLYEKHYVTVPAYSCLCWQVTHQIKSPAALRVLYEHSMTRLKQLMADNVDTSHNLMHSILLRGLKSAADLGSGLEEILMHMLPSTEKILSRFLQGVFVHFTRTGQTTSTQVLTYLTVLAKQSTSPRVAALCRDTLSVNNLGPIVFVTPEFGRFSTVGGIGVMVDELTRSLVSLGCEVNVISPYYNFGKDGKTGYLAQEEGIKWIRNIVTYVGGEKVEVGVHTGVDQGVTHYFLHHFTYFPEPYHSGGPDYQIRALVLLAKATMELLCQIHLVPSVIVTNDWFTGLVPAYVRAGLFGGTFNGTTFFHLVHNLEEAYQGRIFPVDPGDDMGYIHGLPRDLLIDPSWSLHCLNPSRCALLTCNNWGTVSLSYLQDLLRTSVLSPLLQRFPSMFAHSNGIRVGQRRAQLAKIAGSHAQAKRMLQAKYFELVDENIPVFSFVGRIVLQKGVHLILNAVRELMQIYQGKIQILVGGQANMKDPYAASCAWSMESLRLQYKGSFWAAPDKFFSDGPIINLGSDFALMPSLFEPSGVVQQEYFVAGTPVIAFKTGGLKDTVFEYNTTTRTGNGLTFEAHRHADLMQAINRAAIIFKSPEHYEKLRSNCMESVLDMSVVAEAWAREFSRMRRCIWADINVVEREAQKIIKVMEEEEEEEVDLGESEEELDGASPPSVTTKGESGLFINGEQAKKLTKEEKQRDVEI